MPPHKPATLRLPSILDAFRRRGAIRSGAAALAAAALAAACGGGGSSSESPAPPAIPPVRLTGASPWADGCDGVAPTGTVYPGAEVEPHVAQETWARFACRSKASEFLNQPSNSWPFLHLSR